MNIKGATLSWEVSGIQSTIPARFCQTSAELDEATAVLTDLTKLLELATVERRCRLAPKIEKTRRRVNALEHVSSLSWRRRYAITMRLDENSRPT